VNITNKIIIALDQLLRGFIEYYIRFPFESNIVSVFHGVPIAVEDSPEFNVSVSLFYLCETPDLLYPILSFSHS